ncbi:hypothetical protein BCR44DRAFT_1446950 [Catenaria anguillulae PL171]|uniref:Ankyrin repeat-containing domain protein n=1 Tax=Catenaria anguillulae PL171 TaxID=765915 RepID=A0A1Y2H8E7_9FUNG|nr:hypothetical protein BCR44DRAFT_1446950 [Catenaria anguillulae PL171]
MNATSCNLPIELVEATLVHHVASFPALLLPSDMADLLPCLNALPSAIVPLVPTPDSQDASLAYGMVLAPATFTFSTCSSSCPAHHTAPLAIQPDDVVRLAVEAGHLHVLEWWVANGFSLGNKVMAYAEMPKFASVEIRDWCLAHGFVFCPFRKLGQWVPTSIQVPFVREAALQMSAAGDLFALEWWLKDYPRSLTCDQVDGVQCLTVALSCGHWQVAHWWIKTGLCDFNLDQRIVREIAASEFDWLDPLHVLAFGQRVVDAFPLAHSIDPVFFMACAGGQPELVEYCYDHPLLSPEKKAKYQCTAKQTSGWLYSFAAAGGHVHVLNWLFANKFPLSGICIPSEHELQSSCANGRDLLDMLRAVCPFVRRAVAGLLDIVSSNGHVDVLEWFRQHLDQVSVGHYTDAAMNGASRHGHVHVLQWWRDSGIHLLYSHSAILQACNNGQIDVLDWWYRSGLKILPKIWSPEDNPSWWCKSYEVFEWWVLTTKPSSGDLELLSPGVVGCGDWRIMEWYLRNCDSHCVSTILSSRLPSGSVSNLSHPHSFVAALVVCLAHQNLAQSQFALSPMHFSVLAKQGETVISEQLRRCDLLPQCIHLSATCRPNAMARNEQSALWSVATLEWLLRSAHPFDGSEIFVKSSAWWGIVEYLDWWTISGLELDSQGKLGLLGMDVVDGKEELDAHEEGGAGAVSRMLARQWWKTNSHKLSPSRI